MIFRSTYIVVLTSPPISAVITLMINTLSIFIPAADLLYVFVALIIIVLLLYGIFEPSAPIFGQAFWRGGGESQAIALTFDDGPNEPYTSQILSILQEFNIKATFFVIGENIKVFPATLRQEAIEGHEIGNHTYNHKVLPLKSPHYIRRELEATSDLIERISSTKPKLFRAPHGWRNPWVNCIAKSLGLNTVAWTLGVWDTDRPGVEAIVQRTLRRLKSGCILLLHDGKGITHGADSSQLVEALPIIIRKAQDVGYKFLTLSEMMAQSKSS